MRISDWSSDVCSSDLDLTAINLAEMLRTGCTTQVDMSLSLKQMQSYVRVATSFGMRGFPGGMVPGMKRLLPIWTRTDNKVLDDSEARSEEHRVGKGCVSTCRFRRTQQH